MIDLPVPILQHVQQGYSINDRTVEGLPTIEYVLPEFIKQLSAPNPMPHSTSAFSLWPSHDGESHLHRMVSRLDRVREYWLESKAR